MQCCTVLKQRWVECPLKASQAYNGQSTARSTITSKSFGHHFLRINFRYSVHILTSTTTNGIRSILLHCQTNQRIDSLIINKRHGIFTRWILPHQSHTHHWGGRHGSGDILIISNYTQDITMKITSGVNYWPLHTNTKANTPTLVRGAATYNHHALLAPIWKHTHPTQHTHTHPPTHYTQWGLPHALIQLIAKAGPPTHRHVHMLYKCMCAHRYSHSWRSPAHLNLVPAALSTLPIGSVRPTSQSTLARHTWLVNSVRLHM